MACGFILEKFDSGSVRDHVLEVVLVVVLKVIYQGGFPGTWRTDYHKWLEHQLVSKYLV